MFAQGDGGVKTVCLKARYTERQAQTDGDRL